MIQLDGVPLSLPPEQVNWQLPDPFITASGHPAYPGVLQFIMHFPGLTPEQFGQLLSFYNAHKYTYGTALLPSYDNGSEQTFTVIPKKPSFDRFFEGFYLDVVFELEVVL